MRCSRVLLVKGHLRIFFNVFPCVEKEEKQWTIIVKKSTRTSFKGMRIFHVDAENGYLKLNVNLHKIKNTWQFTTARRRKTTKNFMINLYTSVHTSEDNHHRLMTYTEWSWEIVQIIYSIITKRVVQTESPPRNSPIFICISISKKQVFVLFSGEFTYLIIIQYQRVHIMAR